jgi:hypothetical protein
LAVASGPTLSSAKITFLPSSSESRTATGFKVYASSRAPSGRPRWLIRIRLPPRSSTFLIVGSALTMRSSLVMLPLSSCGTLKSTRIRTFLPLTSISATVFLAIKYPFEFAVYHLRLTVGNGRKPGPRSGAGVATGAQSGNRQS